MGQAQSRRLQENYTISPLGAASGKGAKHRSGLSKLHGVPDEEEEEESEDQEEEIHSGKKRNKIKLSCRMPNIGNQAAENYLKRRNEERKLTIGAEHAIGVPFDFPLSSLPKEKAQLIHAILQGKDSHEEIPPESNEKKEKTKKGQHQKLTKEERLENALLKEFSKPKTENEVQQEKVNAALLGATVGTAVILTAMGIQSALSYTFEALMPAKSYKFLYLWLLMFLYLVLLIFFVVFWCA